MTVPRQQCSCPATKQSTQQEWQSYTPLMCSPTTASPERLSPTEIPASLQTSPERCAVCWELSRTSQRPTTHKQMAKANEPTNPWSNTYDYIAEHIKRTGQHGYRWPSIPGTPGLTRQLKRPPTN